MEQQPRTKQDRRAHERRVFNDPWYKGPDRRKGMERREGDRRTQR